MTKRNRSLITEIPTRHEPIGGGKGCSHKGSVPGPVQPILRVVRDSLRVAARPQDVPASWRQFWRNPPCGGASRGEERLGLSSLQSFDVFRWFLLRK
jgi:hypothetical protein